MTKSSATKDLFIKTESFTGYKSMLCKLYLEYLIRIVVLNVIERQETKPYNDETFEYVEQIMQSLQYRKEKNVNSCILYIRNDSASNFASYTCFYDLMR